MSERPSVPVTVIVPERHSVELLQRSAADPGVMLIASAATLARAGLLDLIRAGRAMVIAPDVASRTPGCECCQVRLDLIDAVRLAVLRQSPPQRLVVVVDRADTSSATPGTVEPASEDPASDVVTVTTTLHTGSEVGRFAHLGGVIVEVDARAASTRLASGFVMWDPHTESALAIADTIVVTGSEFLTDQARSAVADSVRLVNRIGVVSFSRAEAVDVERLIDLNVWNRAPTESGSSRLQNESRRTWPEAPPTHVEAHVETVVLHRCGVLEPDATNAWLDRVVAGSPRGLLRLQASLRVSTRQPRVCIWGSRSTMRSSPEPHRDASPNEQGYDDNDNVVVLIGRELDRHALSESFEAIEVAR